MTKSFLVCALLACSSALAGNDFLATLDNAGITYIYDDVGILVILETESTAAAIKAAVADLPSSVDYRVVNYSK